LRAFFFCCLFFLLLALAVVTGPAECFQLAKFAVEEGDVKSVTDSADSCTASSASFEAASSTLSSPASEGTYSPSSWALIAAVRRQEEGKKTAGKAYTMVEIESNRNNGGVSVSLHGISTAEYVGCVTLKIVETPR